MSHPTVFISYSHQDETEKDEIVAHLSVLESEGLLDVWVDDRIGAGSEWAKDIDQAIGHARVAILLITKNFLTSKFILQTEVPRLLQRRQDDSLTVFPVIARHCAWRKVGWLTKMNVRPKNGAPVWREGGRYADEHLAAIAEEVADIIDKAQPLPEPVAQPEPPTQVPAAPESPKTTSDATVATSGSQISRQDLASLKEALESGTLALFIGADLPREITGLPSRADLARTLARRKELDESLSLAEIAQRVSRGGNRWEFTNFLRTQLDMFGQSPLPFHHRIVKLVESHRLNILIVTAYDNLLNLAFQQAGIKFNQVVGGDDVNFIAPDRPTLIKLYGDILQPDTLIVTDQDHTDLLRNRDKEQLIDEVKRAFLHNTVLFIGYNLADSDFRLLFDQIAQSRFARTAYAVWPGLPEVDVRMWRDRGIVVLEADPLPYLVEST